MYSFDAGKQDKPNSQEDICGEDAGGEEQEVRPTTPVSDGEENEGQDTPAAGEGEDGGVGNTEPGGKKGGATGRKRRGAQMGHVWV